MFSFFCKHCGCAKVGIVKSMKLYNKIEWTNDKIENTHLSMIDYLIAQGIFDRIYDVEIDCINCRKQSKILSFIKIM